MIAATYAFDVLLLDSNGTLYSILSYESVTHQGNCSRKVFHGVLCKARFGEETPRLRTISTVSSVMSAMTVLIAAYMCELCFCLTRFG